MITTDLDAVWGSVIKENRSDILVVGGGPAGSTAAAFLSEMGWCVTLLERDSHPRFHIGESLLPGNMEIFDRLGVVKNIEKIGVVKFGADFTSPSARGYEVFDFSRAGALKHKSAFQVRRSEFDHMLLTNAATKGANIIQGMDAFEVQFGGQNPVLVRGRDEEGKESLWSADFLVDATGRETFVADRLNLKTRNRFHNSAAIFTQFTGAELRAGSDAGNISIYWFDHGWFWFIPLTGGVTSVGVVCDSEHLKTRTSSTDQFLLECIESCPPLARRLRNATQIMTVKATGNFSYQAKKMYGDHFLLIGDAYGFIDPVFSSGVLLAMFGGDMGAKTVDACLRNPYMRGYYLHRHARVIRKGIRRLSWFIYRFTDPAMQKMFLDPKNIFKVQDSVISLLAGDIFYKCRLTFPLLIFKGIFHLIRLFNRK